MYDVEAGFLLDLAISAGWLTGIERSIHNWAATLGESGSAVFRLILAAFLGGIVGLEREIRGHEAGFRTFMLVAAGAALAMIVSMSFSSSDWVHERSIADRGERYLVSVDPARIAYGVMTGVGFLGAGTIIQRRNRVEGLTTAAGIWSVAALGLAAGFGLYVVSITATLLLLSTLLLLGWFRSMLPTVTSAQVKVSAPYGADCVERFVGLLDEFDMDVLQVSYVRSSRRGAAILDARVKYIDRHKLDRLRRRLLESDQYRLLKLR